jgi:glycosyltransferase involved in cell wall biosynthesis
MRVFLNVEPRRGAYGGANAFLRTLTGELRRRGVSFTSDPAGHVDVALVNALTGGIGVDDVRRLAERGVPVVHRKTGYRGRGAPGLRAVVGGVVLGDAHQIAFSPYLRHTIFQSGYSRDVFVGSGFAGRYSIVPNGVDEAVFNREPGRGLLRAGPREQWRAGEPVRVVVSTWSTDQTKGFRLYREIDAALAGSRAVRLELVGRLPAGTRLETFRVHRARGPADLAALLKRQHVLLHLTEHESCSNALIEGINCGLPAVYLDSGANDEVAHDYGVRWEDDLLEALGRLLPRYGEIVARIPDNPYRISLVAGRYLEILKSVAQGREPPGARHA